MIAVLIFSLSALKYFYQALIMSPFEADQEFLALQAWKIVKEHQFTLIGAPTSAGGLFIGPLYTYFVVLVMLITRFNPHTINFLSALWASLTPLVIYIVGKNLFSRRVGIFAGLLAATSTSFLNLNQTPPLVAPLALVSLLVFYCLTKLKSQPRLYLLAALLAGLSFNLHFTGLFICLLVILWPLVFRHRLPRSTWFSAAFIALVFFAPLVIFDLRHNFFLTQNFIKFLLVVASPLKGLISSSKLFLAISGESINNLLRYNLIFGFLSVLGLIFSHSLLLWTLVPVILNTFYSGSLLPYYFVMVLPQIYLATGLLLARLKFLPLFFLLLIIQIALGINWFARQQYSFNLRYKTQAFEFIAKQKSPATVNLSFTVLPWHRRGLDYLRLYYGFDDLLLADRPTYTIVIPSRWHEIQPDVTFGDIGIVLP